MDKVILSLGGNEGDKSANFLLAAELIEKEVGNLILESAIYETEPWGFETENLFWNQVIVAETELSVRNVLTTILDIEARMGRVRNGAGYTSRPMDIDILFYDVAVINEPDLIVPHPLLAERNFVLLPLADICPDLVHPVLKKTIRELIDTCKDQGGIRKVDLSYPFQRSF